MQIAVYPGSFDPMHIGHLAILRLLCSDDRFDEVRLIVSPQNPLKGEGQYANAAERLEAARRVLKKHKGFSKVIIDEIEFTLPCPHYTIATLDVLANRHPGDKLTLVVGADNLKDIRRWKDHGRILKDYGVAVCPRDGINLSELKKELEEECQGARITLLDSPEVSVSSTCIREALSEGRDISNLIA